MVSRQVSDLKMVRNGKINTKSTGSSHGEQLEPKQLTVPARIPQPFPLFSFSYFRAFVSVVLQ